MYPAYPRYYSIEDTTILQKVDTSGGLLLKVDTVDQLVPTEFNLAQRLKAEANLSVADFICWRSDFT